MLLQAQLVKKNLDENFVVKEGDDIIEPFMAGDKTYAFTKQHSRTLALNLKFSLTDLIELETEKFIIAGGSVLSLLMYSSPFLINDIDIFPCSEQDYNSLKAKLDVAIKMKGGGAKIRENENSRTYIINEFKIDLIKKFYETPKDLFKAFDLDIVCVGYDEKWNFHSGVSLSNIFSFHMSLQSEIKPEEAFTRLRRVMKYAVKGFEIDQNELIDLYATIKSGEKKTKDKVESSIKTTTFVDGVQLTMFSENNVKFEEARREAEKEAKKGYHTLVETFKYDKVAEAEYMAKQEEKNKKYEAAKAEYVAKHGLKTIEELKETIMEDLIDLFPDKEETI